MKGTARRSMESVTLTVCFAAVIATPALLAPAAAGDCVPPPLNMIGWWPGDGDANDIQGGHNGTLEGSASFDVGKVDSAFSFDGGGTVNVSDGPAWGFGDNAFTIDLWANFSVVQGRDPFISHDEGGYEVDKWIFWYDASGHRAPGGPALRFHINGPTLGPLDPVVFPWAPETGRWYHLAVTRSGSTYKLYIDGVAVIEEIDTHTIQDAGAPLQIGAAESYSFKGRIDEVEIFNRALSPAEIEAIYNAGSAGKCKEPPGCSGDGDPCDDGNACTEGDRCQSAVCSGTPINCRCHEPDLCNPLSGTCSIPVQPDGTSCDDGNSCTSDDVCAAGRCTGDVMADCAPPCPAAPIPSGCNRGESLTGKLQIRDKTGTSRDQAQFKWNRNLVAVTTSGLGDPLTDTGYALCVYDSSSDTPFLSLSARVALGGTCGTKPCWKANSSGDLFQYRDKASTADGITRVKLKAGPVGKARAQVKAKGGNLLLPAPAASDRFFHQDASVKAQLINSRGTCWEADYAPENSSNMAEKFTGRND